MSSRLNLRFGPGSPAGFTPAGIAAFDDLRPAAVVRELIQNSLDAAVAAEEPTAIVRFRLTTCDAHDVPGIEAYRRAFERAVQSHRASGSLPSKAKRVVTTIQRALEQEQLKVLSILDNGVGLDGRRMTALLSDGVSAKGASSSGTYGNGHSVAIPASDLRYALYGGLTSNGKRIAAGHAVLASHAGDHGEYASSGDGFLVRGFRNGRDGVLFDYAREGSIPPIIKRELDDIALAGASAHGTVVILPAFNSFKEKKRSFSDMVLKAAACNFFVAIEEGRLEVWVEDEHDGGQEAILDSTMLADTLAQHQEQTRSRAFLSGGRAFDAHRALRFGKSAVIETSQGAVEIRLKEGVDTTRVDLCRNGMWITDDKRISAFYYKFTDRIPFHAVLLLNAEQGGRLHQLIRNAEGPLHDKIRLKDLSKKDRRDLTAALGEIRAWILENTTEVAGDSFGVDHFLAFDFGESDQEAGGASSGASYQGRPSVVRRRTPTWYSTSNGTGRRIPQREKGSGKTNLRRPRRGPVLSSAFQAISHPSQGGRRRICITCKESCEDAVLRLRVNENVDATCDPLWHEIVPVILEAVLVDGKEATLPDLVSDAGNIVGVKLGALASGESIEVETGYRVPDAFRPWGRYAPSLRVEIVEGIVGNPHSEES